MSEDNDLGAPKPAPDYEPMADPFAPVQEEKTTYGNDLEGLRDAANDLDDERRKNEEPIVERKYYDVKEGQYTGKDADANLTVSLERASQDLDRQRNWEVAQQQTENDAAVQMLTDAKRAVDQQQQLQQTAQPQQPPQPQPQTDEEAMRQALDNPKIREALDLQVQQLESQRAAYAKQAEESAAFARATLFSNFEELNGVTTENLSSVLAAIEKLDPQRHIAVVKALHATDRLHKIADNARAQEAQIQQARVQMWANDQEKQFVANVIAKEPKEVVAEVSKNGPRILAEHFGIDQDAFRQMVASNPGMRSAPAMALIFDAIKTKLAHEQLAQKRAPAPVPPVQRPGVSRPASSDDDTSAALRAFKSNPNDLRLAAAYVNARRAARK